MQPETATDPTAAAMVGYPTIAAVSGAVNKS